MQRAGRPIPHELREAAEAREQQLRDAITAAVAELEAGDGHAAQGVLTAALTDE
ncbi:hypothetical protein [Curtobacterium sp. MCBD17_040]|uniref:hypothetical protein n=1 Tax=Curtobacterium sp. MCBD17_040 TaxID=2175674 RepID=UPI0015E8B554|nr:hypothetical protein [Curtobacterium sp. MCBD17_040]WIB65672.1 hypothetical protein DEI94_16255 [Curtobacterium sp. MCBD17_040]